MEENCLYSLSYNLLCDYSKSLPSFITYDSDNAPTEIRIESYDILSDPGTYFLLVEAQYGKIMG